MRQTLLVSTWRPGDAVVLRELWDGRVWAARPVTVVEDSPGQQRFYVPSGDRWMAAVDDRGEPLHLPARAWTLAEFAWHGGAILSFAWPATPYAVLGFFDRLGRLAGWYVNLQRPLARTAIGFDTVDHVLDVLVDPGGTGWRWKDEEEMEEAIGRGLFTREDAATFRADGERAARRIVDRAPPFDADWSTWRPDPSWPAPSLPDRWDAPGRMA
jgi:hypothetical protein